MDAESAHAGGDVGVVVTGEPTMQPQVLALIEGWLKAHGHRVIASPLPPDATNKLIDCFVIEDTTCARKLIEEKAASASLVFARVEVVDSPGMRDVTITGYWFERGSEPVAEKRACPKCSDTRMVMAGDELMTALAGTAMTTVGQLLLSSFPTGAQVVIDGKAAGQTPLEVALPPGPHQITLSAAGMGDETRTVTIVKGKSVYISKDIEEYISRYIVFHPRPLACGRNQ